MKNKLALKVIKAIFDEQNSFEGNYDYELVDDFYGFLGYGLMIEKELQELEIYGTSDLQVAFIKLEEE